jgi:hypothetical protein
MSIFDEAVQGIVDAFFQEGNNWRERIGDATITFISPETSTEFAPKWVDGRKSTDKKIGLFEYPNIKGTVAQDLKSTSDRFSITCRFVDYENNDLQARDFYAVCAREAGRWTVIHPVYGQLGLQLISIEESKSSREGGYTEVRTKWIEDIDPDQLQTQRELAGLVDGQCSTVQLNSIEQFVATCDATSREFRATIEDTVQGIQNVVDFVLSPLFATNDVVSGAITSVAIGIQGSIDAVLLPLSELAGQIQNTVNLPLLASQDSTARIQKYAALLEGLSALLPGESSSISARWATKQAKINNAATAELASISALVAFAQIVITSTDISTRRQAIDLATQVSDQFVSVIETYELQQEDFEAETIDKQYYAVGLIYNDLLKLLGLTLAYLQNKITDLKIERTFVLTEPRSVAEICLTEFGTLDEYDNIIATNRLKGSEILLLPAGREITLNV